VGVDGAAGEARSLPGSGALSTGDGKEGGSAVRAISLVAGFCVEIVSAGRSSMVERRGAMLACGVVPSTADREIPSCDMFTPNGPLACLYASCGADFQGHHANTLRSQRLIACVIIVFLLSVC
jgi:hypothetical protein